MTPSERIGIGAALGGGNSPNGRDAPHVSGADELKSIPDCRDTVWRELARRHTDDNDVGREPLPPAQRLGTAKVATRLVALASTAFGEPRLQQRRHTRRFHSGYVDRFLSGLPKTFYADLEEHGMRSAGKAFYVIYMRWPSSSISFQPGIPLGIEELDRAIFWRQRLRKPGSVVTRGYLLASYIGSGGGEYRGAVARHSGHVQSRAATLDRNI